MCQITSIWLVTFMISILHSNAQIPGFGRCPKISATKKFDAHRYLGRWYEVRKYPFIFTLGGSCVEAIYGLNPNGTVSVFNKQIRNGKEDKILGSARLVDPEVGVLAVSFPNVPFQAEANYNILYTDYDKLSVVFSCNSFLNLVNGKVVWILTRSRFPSQEIITKAYSVLKDNGISTTYLAITDNNNCPDDQQSNNIHTFHY